MAALAPRESNMNLLLILLACNGLSLDRTPGDGPKDPGGDDGPVAREVRLPTTEVVTRKCWVDQEEREPTAGRKGSGGPLGKIFRSRSQSAPSAAAPAPAPMPSYEMAPEPEAADMGSATGMPAPTSAAPMGGGGSQGAATSSALLAGDGARASAPADLDNSVADTLATATPAEVAAADPQQAAAEPARAASGASKDDVARKPASTSVAPRRPPRPQPKREEAKVAPPKPVIDWGGTTWLSNDDSMSLASAQRLLWAVKNGQPFKPSEVRPHELLNYFSFDTAPIEPGQTFSVLGSAAQTGPETLSVALAVKGANPPRQPLDLTLVVDVSGSMWAEGRMDYVKRGLHKVEGQLKRGDRVDLVLFDHDDCTPLESWVAGRDDASLLTQAIDAIEPRGSTNLDRGLKEGYRLAKQWADQDTARERNHRVMILTDALINEGELNPDTISLVAESYERSGVRLSGVGVGTEFNDKVLDRLTEKGKGAYVFLGTEAVVDRILGTGFDSLTRTIAHDVRFALDLPESLGMAKFYGEESSADPEDVKPIHYFADTSQVFLQDLHVREGRLVLNDPVTLKIVWRDASTDEPREQVWNTTVGGLIEGGQHNVNKARALMGWSDVLLAQAMGGDPCGQPFSTFRDRVGSLGDDAEISYVAGLTGPYCGVDMAPILSSGGGVAYRVKLDSDVPIAEVELACSGAPQKQTLASGDSVARFSAQPGACTLTLQGPVPLVARVEVPSSGGDVRCMVRGGRLSCS